MYSEAFPLVSRPARVAVIHNFSAVVPAPAVAQSGRRREILKRRVAFHISSGRAGKACPSVSLTSQGLLPSAPPIP